jgi:hypothetical protein
VQLVHELKMLPPPRAYALRKKIWNSISPWSSMLATTGDVGA